MKKIYLLGGLMLSALSFAQAPITALNTPYEENFDGMGAAGTAFPTHWTAIRAAGTGTANQTLTMAVTDGSANSGNIYNVGTTSSTERAFGSIASGSTSAAFGMSFVNNTGDQITVFKIDAVVEQWRTGSSDTTHESVAFAYSLDATSLQTGTWTTVSALNLNEILTTSKAANSVDGNLTANQSILSSTINISSSPWLNNNTLWIKWVDTDAFSSDCLLAIDNFSFTAKSSTLSAEKFDNIAGLNVSPNPATTELNVTSNSFASKTVELYNVLGKLALKATVTNQAINVASLAKGVYVAKVTEEGKVATRKIVIE